MQGDASAALEMRGVGVRFASAAGDYPAVRDIGLTLGRGEFVAIVGPTGSGKSTILNVAAGLLEPVEGEVRVFGRPLAGVNPQAGYLFQADALMPWKSCLDNVAVGLEVRGMSRTEARRQAGLWLPRVGLAGFADNYPHALSGGMRKRASLAQMLIRDPPILLMDEPFAALDVQTRYLMSNLLLDLWSADRKAALFITHDLEEAISLADRVLLLSAGPAARLIGEYAVDLPRPRDVAEVRLSDPFVELHRRLWADLRSEVQKSYAGVR